MGTPDTPAEQPQLGLWDAVSIIIGIVIGSSIFLTPPIIFEGVAGPWEGLGVWLFCGGLSLIGALCYAELATTYPRAGGDYVYLTRGFDRPVGFLFGWAQLAVILSGSAGMMAFIFGQYAAGLLEVPAEQKPTLAVQIAAGAVVVLTAFNLCGVVLGKWVQNALVVVKLLGLALIIVAGFGWPASDPFAVAARDPARGGGGLPVAIILVLYAYGGWNDAAFVAADLRQRRDIPKALLLGTAGIVVIYLLVNLAYLVGLGFERARTFTPTIAADVLANAFGEKGRQLMSGIVMVSALGAMNGLIFTGSRVYLALGKEHRTFALLGRWNATVRAPVWSLVAQAVVTLGLLFLVGTAAGRDAMDQGLGSVGIPPIPWEKYHGGFDTLFAGTAPVFWIFFLLTGFSVFALRARDPHLPRPFRLATPWYPILPIIFCGMCLFGFMSAMSYAGWVSLLGFVPLLAGLPLYLLSGPGEATISEPPIPTDERSVP